MLPPTQQLPKVNARTGPNPYPVLLVFDNRAIARAGASVSADSTAPEGPKIATKLLTEFSFDRWQSDSVLARSLEIVPEIVVTYDFQEMAAVDFLHVGWSNNLMPWRGDLYRDALLVGTTDWMAPIVKSEPEDFDYFGFPWLLSPTGKRIDRMAAEMKLSSFAHLSEVVYGVNRIKFRFYAGDGANGTADFLEVGMMLAGLSWQPDINMSYGADITPKPLSVKRYSAAGVRTGVDRPTPAEISFSLEYLTAHDAQTILFQEWVREQPDSARIFVYKEPQPDARGRYYDGGAFVGPRESFEGAAIEEEPGSMNGIAVEKTAKGIKIREE